MRSTTEGGDVDAVEALRAASSAYAVISAAPTLTLMPVDAEGTEGGAGQPDAVLVVTHARPTGRTRTETDSVYASFAAELLFDVRAVDVRARIKRRDGRPGLTPPEHTPG
jgi:hypothetical protein